MINCTLAYIFYSIVNLFIIMTCVYSAKIAIYSNMHKEKDDISETKMMAKKWYVSYINRQNHLKLN